METREGIVNPWPGALVIVKERTSSTMDDALDLFRGGCPTGTAVIAGFQERGRGRVPGRTWLSPPWESLLATVVLRRTGLGFPLHQVPLRAGVAVARAVEETAGLMPAIKWPNDIVVDGRKLAGLLCESHGDAVLVGAGVNCTQSAFPPEIADTACSLLQASGLVVSVSVLAGAVLRRLRQAVEEPDWREGFLARLHGRGARVVVDLLGSGESLEGILRDVDEECRLVLELASGEVARVAQGEIRPGA